MGKTKDGNSERHIYTDSTEENKGTKPTRSKRKIQHRYDTQTSG